MCTFEESLQPDRGWRNIRVEDLPTIQIEDGSTRCSR
jgi:hypothetical protein